MNVTFYKYHGTGNDFIIIDDRRDTVEPELSVERIKKICQRRFSVGSDGLILLKSSSKHDFKMLYYNSDGKPSSFCGNGGRCIVSFAKRKNLFQSLTTFEATDGLHYASVDKNELISLSMNDVEEIKAIANGYFLDTGSPHYVEFVKNTSDTDIISKGREIRNSKYFSPGGTNVNFVEIIDPSTIKIRTYERGVESETLSCGTGVTAATIAFCHSNNSNSPINVITEGGSLSVSFVKKSNNIFTDIKLIGSTSYVYEGKIDLSEIA